MGTFFNWLREWRSPFWRKSTIRLKDISGGHIIYQNGTKLLGMKLMAQNWKKIEKKKQTTGRLPLCRVGRATWNTGIFFLALSGVFVNVIQRMKIILEPCYLLLRQYPKNWDLISSRPSRKPFPVKDPRCDRDPSLILAVNTIDSSPVWSDNCSTYDTRNNV